MSNAPVPINLVPVKIADPKCPRCRHVLNFAHRIVVTQSRAVISMLWCSDCGHVLHTQWLGESRPGPPPSSIITPN